MITKLLSTSAHNSAETAYVIGDWPYGRTLRCEKHCWIETRKNFGQRFCYRTTNPKRGGTFNAVKGGTYSAFTVFGEDENGLLVIDGINSYSGPEKFKYLRSLGLDEQQTARLNAIEIYSRKVNPREWENTPVAIAPFSNTALLV